MEPLCLDGTGAGERVISAAIPLSRKGRGETLNRVLKRLAEPIDRNDFHFADL